VQLPSASGVAGFLAGPALGGAPTVQMFKGRQLTISHQIDPGVGIPDRNFVDVTLEPFRNRHLIGRYILKLTSSGALKVHVWVDYGDGYGLEIRTVPALPAFVHTDENHQISSNGGADNIITVAAYNAEIGPGFPLVDFSSRGPLATYTGGPPPRAKPDIAAPGLDIDAAKSRHIVPPEPGDHTQMSGTSMAAPHVTGAVALMFQQNPALDVTQIRTILQAHVAGGGTALTADEAGSGRIDAKDAFDNVP
jgi:hypothetical protein